MLKKNKICAINNCNNSSEYFDYGRNGYCCKHNAQIKKYGNIFIRTKFDRNEYIDCGDYYEICLYKGKGEQVEVDRTKIDKDDYNKVKDYKWSLDNNGYVRINKKNKTIRLHQLILGKKFEYEIDHINRDRLDNRKKNLRHATSQINNRNRTGVKGYRWDKERGKWIVRVGLDKKTIFCGRYINECDAKKASEDARLKYFN